MTEVERSNSIVFKILKTFYVDPPPLYYLVNNNTVIKYFLNSLNGVHHTTLY